MAAPPGSPAGSPDRLLGRVLLITGSEEFLSDRTVQAARRSVLAVDPEAEIGETSGDQLTLGTLGELSAPSLFSSTRFVLVRRLEDLPEESVDGILAYAAAPADEVALVLVHTGGARGSGVVNKLKKLGTVVEVKSEGVSVRELPNFVVNEFRALKVRIDPEAAAFLIQAVGQDLRALSAACTQLANDAGALAAAGVDGHAGARADTVGIDLVKRYFGGRAEAKSFAVADLTLEGRTAQALEELRWALERGVAPVLVTSAISGSLRQLARLSGLPRGGRDSDVASALKAPPWKVRVLRNQLRGWQPEGLARAIGEVARADADVKGQASDASYALERMVLTVSRLRTR